MYAMTTNLLLKSYPLPSGLAIKNVELNIVPVVAKREAKQKYLSMQMEDVLIKSITTGGSITEDYFEENILLLFSKIRFEYNINSPVTTENPAGKSIDYKFGWDLAMNQEW